MRLSTSSRRAVYCTGFFLAFAITLPGAPAHAQPDASAERSQTGPQHEMAERFLQLLLQRPRPGTALDRLYGYHIQAGTLDSLLDQLRHQAQVAGDEAAAHWMLLGLLQLQRGEEGAATESLGKAESLTDDAMASYYLGRALLLVGQTGGAAEALERSIARGPHRNEALPVFTELGRIYARAGQHEQALGIWTRLEQLFPGDTRVAEQIARTLAEEGQLEAALQRYLQLTQSVEEDDSYSSISFAVSAAELKRRLGRDDEALRDLEQLLDRLRPGSWLHSDVRRRIEAGFLRDGDHGALADYYARQLQQNPDDLETRMRLGRALSGAGRLNDAVELLSVAVDRAPQDGDVRLAFVDALRKANRPGEVADQLRILCEQDPDNPDYYVQLGNALLADEAVDLERRRQAAAAAWQQLADRRSADAVITAQVADLMRRIDHTDSAISLYRRAVQLAPDEPQYREYLGEYLHSLDRKDEALAVWRSLAEGDRRNRQSLIRRAEVYSVFGYASEALDSFAAAAELDPTFSERLRFATLLAEATQYEEALSQLKTAETIAEAPEDYDQVLQQRIAIYGSSGTLLEQIAELERKLMATTAAAEDLRQLALMRNAAGETAGAIEAIGDAVEQAPRDVRVLSVAAELYRQNSELPRAVDIYRQLSTLDAQHRVGYLQRVAELQMRLGKADDALATARELISASPGTSSAYRTYADFCFQAGRHDEGIETLRRALRAAPRDDATRRALGSALALRFCTDEAIELYWQGLESAIAFKDQRLAVQSLAPLYERKGDLAQLIGRLEQFGRERSDGRRAALLVADAYETTNDLGRARETLQPLLADDPHDADLLLRMSYLSERADDLQAAYEYQQQLVDLADTPANRGRLLSLMVGVGLSDAVLARLRRFRSLTDVQSIVDAIDRTMAQQDFENAATMCRETLAGRGELWDVETRLALCLLLDSTSDNDDAAVELAEQILNLQLPHDAPPPSARKPNTPPRTSLVPPGYFRQPDGRLGWVHTSRFSRLPYTLAVSKGLGRYASYRYSFSAYSFQVPSLDRFADARHCATGVVLAVAATRNQLEEVFDEKFDAERIDASSDAQYLWDAYGATRYRETFTSNSPSNPFDPLTCRIARRLAVLGAEHGARLYAEMLRSRQSRRANPSAPGAADAHEPLGPEDLAVLPKIVEHLDEELHKDSNAAHYAAVYEELKLAGRNSEANAIYERFASPPETFGAIANALRFFIAIKEGAPGIPLLDSARRIAADQPGTLEPSDVQQMATTALSLIEHLDDPEEWTSTLDEGLRLWNLAMRLDPQRRARYGAPGHKPGTVSAYRVTPAGSSQQIIEVPFSESLLERALAQQLYFALQADDPKSERCHVLLRWLAESSRDEASDSQERLLRGCCAAFASWWTGDPRAAYQQIDGLSEQFAENVHVQIEKARLAAELNRPRESLALLDAVTPLDQQTLQTRELAAINLAVHVGDEERARVAARRLCAMQLDSATQLTLVDQLDQLGMQEMSRAILLRQQRRGGQSDAELLALAQMLKESGNEEAASEAAYRVLQRLSSGRSSQGHYRQQAVQILSQLNRFDQLIEQAERRANNAPKSVLLQGALAELYLAAGRHQQADDRLQIIARLQPREPRMLIQAAERLYRLGRRDEAFETYLTAFEQHPALLGPHINALRRVISTNDQLDEVYKAASEWGLQKLTVSQLRYLSQLSPMPGRGIRNRDNDVQPARRAFLESAIEAVRIAHLGELLCDLSRSDSLFDSPRVAARLVRVLAADELYVNGSPFWQSGRYAANGGLSSPLAFFLEVLRYNPELVDVVRESLAEKKKQAQTQQLAEGMLIALDVRAERHADVPQRVDAILAATADDTHDKALAHMLWAIAQTMEDSPLLQPSAVKLLERVNAFPFDDRSFRTAILAKLVDVYAKTGSRDKAVAELTRRFREPGFSKSPSSNWGYNNYSELQSWASIAEKLTKVEAPLEAIQVYYHALAHPEKFVAARSVNSGDLKSDFERSLQQTLEATRTQGCIDYIHRLANSIDAFVDGASREASTVSPIRIGAFPPTRETRGPTSSAAALALSKLDGRSAANAALRKLDESLSRARESAMGSDRIHALAFAVLIAIQLRPETAVDHLEHLIEALPETDVGPEEGASGDATTEILPLYSIALVALASEDAALAGAGIRLRDRLFAAARKSDSGPHLRALATAQMHARLDQRDEQLLRVLRELLDARAAPIETLRPISNADAHECMRIARAAVSAGDPALSIEAVRRVLAAGPPVAVNAEENSSGSGFLLPIKPSSPASLRSSRPAVVAAEKQEDPLPIASTVLEFADAWSRAGAGDAAIYEALAAIVLPAGNDAEVLLHSIPLFTVQAEGPVPDGTPQPKSVARRLAEVAASSGKADALRTQVEGVRHQLEEKWKADVLLLQLACATGDAEQWHRAVKQLAETVDGILPSVERLQSITPPPRSLYVRRDTLQIQLIDALLHVLVPLLEAEHQDASVDELAMRTLGCAVPQTHALGGVTITDWVTDRLLQRLSDRRDWQSLSLLVQLQVALVRARYANYSGVDAEQQVQREHSRLANELAKFSAWEAASDLIRAFASRDDGLRPRLHFHNASAIALQLAEARPAERYRMLHRLTFGPSGKGPLINWDGYLLYEQPPAELTAQTPALEKVRRVRVAHRYLPVVSTALLLVDAAFDNGDVEAVLQAARTQVGSPGDEAEALAGLVELRRGAEPAAAAALQHVHQNIVDGAPRGVNPELKFPILAAAFAAQCLEADVERQLALDTLEILRSYARQGQLPQLTSGIHQLLARNGRTPAAGGTPASPLAHWLVMPIPPLGDPAGPPTQPLYRLADGTVRFASGNGTTALMLKYPVAGEFNYRLLVQQDPGGSASLAYGGVEYAVDSLTGNGKAAGLADRGHFIFSGSSDQHEKQLLYQLDFTDGVLEANFGGRLILADLVRPGMPFVSVISRVESPFRFGSIVVDGRVAIPRFVDLIGPELAGWGTLYYGGLLPDLRLPRPLNRGLDVRLLQAEARGRPVKDDRTWYSTGGHLRSGSGAAEKSRSGMRQITYLRPLCAGESVSYQFWYVPGSAEVHPTLGRVAILLRPEGPRLRWLAMESSLESAETEPLHEVTPRDMLLGKNRDMPLKPGDWNKVTLTADDTGRTITVALNQTPLCRVAAAEPQPFGLLAERDRSVDVQNAILTGPWPEQLPEDLMEVKQESKQVAE